MTKATSAGTVAPAGTRSAGTRKTSSAKSARASTSSPTRTTKKTTAKVASKTTVARKTSPKKAMAKKKTVKKAPKKRASARTRKKKIAEIVESSVAPEMAAAMMGEMGMNEEAAIEKQQAQNEREQDLLSRLAVTMNRHDEMPNLELAANIVFAMDEEAVVILSSIIARRDDIYAPDAARVIREVGEREPDLLLPVLDELVAVCELGETDMLPFAMYALSPVAPRVATSLWDMREVMWSVLSDSSEHSDLAHEAAVRLLSALCAAGPDYARTLAGGLVDLLGKCNPKDVALYAESVLPALGSAHSHRAKPVLDRRMKELTPAEVARLRRAVRAAQTGGPSYSYAA